MLTSIGESVTRSEDRRLLSGRGRFTDDIIIPGMVHAIFLRSPHASALIKSMNLSDARKIPEIIGIFTGYDLNSELGNIPCFGTHKRLDGSPMYVPSRPILSSKKVVFIGEPIAVVIGKNISAAKKAIESIVVDYEIIESVTDVKDAASSEAPTIWKDCQDNKSFTYSLGDKFKVEKEFGKAAFTTSIEYSISRVYAAPMETRAAIGNYDTSNCRYELYSGTQGPHNLRKVLAQNILNVPENNVRVISPDMGGAFGMRSGVYPEMAVVLWASKQLGLPVKWNGERSEGFLGDEQARDNFSKVSLALDENYKFTALKVKTLAALGGYLSTGGASPPTVNLGGLAGVYTTPTIYVEVDGIFTNTSPTSAYRGAGRPEASFAIERIIDVAARELNIDPVELRRKNTIPKNKIPYKTPLIFEYDSGNFLANLDEAIEKSDYKGFKNRQQLSYKKGLLRGFGIANVVERAAGMGEESAEIRVDSSGSVTILVGTHSHGQGHETVYKQIVSQQFSLDWEKIHFVQGDTDLVSHGFGTFGSRSSGLGGSAINLASEKIISKMKKIVAHILEVDESDLEYKNAKFTALGTDKYISWSETCRQAYKSQLLPDSIEPSLIERAIFNPKSPTFPNGCHCVEIEIDPETGSLIIIKYTVVDDFGTVLNPLLLKGQIHGGLAQGIGQILMEEIIYDTETGQLLSGSFMDYCMPRALDFPFFEVFSNPDPTSVNPLGVKGAGEAGTVGAMPALMNAIFSALAPLGVKEIEMPASPEKIWKAINHKM